MSLLESIDSLPLVEALGWTLIHFLWQGAFIAGLIWMVLYGLRHRAANARYLVCCAGMILMFAAPVVTLAMIVQPTSKPITESALSLMILDLDRLPIWEKLTPFMPWLALFWLCGTAFLQGRIVLNWTNAQRMKRHGARPASKPIRHLLDRLCKQLNIRAEIRLLESSLAQVPMVLGWLKPIILVPSYALTGLTSDQLKAVLAHELAHVKRHDYLVNIFQVLFEALLFYHPAVWWLSSRLRAEREFCCDDVAVNLCRDKLCYARALTSLDEMRDVAVQTAMAMTGGSLMNRIYRIVGVSSKSTNRLGGWLAPMLIVLSLTTAVTALSFASTAGPDLSGPLLHDDGGQSQDPDQEKKIALQKKETEALDQKAKELAKKMKAAGKSEKEIKMAVSELYKNAEFARTKSGHEADWKAEFAMKEKALVKKMKADGKSEKKIQKAVMDLKFEFENAAKQRQMEEEFKKKEEMIVKKMKAAGKSKEEIKEALAEFHAQNRVKVKKTDETALKEKIDQLVKTMEKEGKSKKEIKMAIYELEMKHKKLAEKK